MQHALEGVPMRVLGKTGGDDLVVGERVKVSVRRLQQAWEDTFPQWVG